MLVVVIGDRRISIPFAKGETLLEVLRRRYPISAPCGGNGKCGKCTVTLERSGKRACVLACSTFAEEEDIVFLDFDENFEKREGIGKFAAVDIGTTTVCYRIFDEKYALIRENSFINPQIGYGADVISRIHAAANGHLKEMHDCLLRRLNAEIGTVSRTVFASNPTMAHLLLGESPQGLGVAPFRPVFLDTQRRKGSDVGLHAEECVVLPSIDAFLGSDAVAGASFLREKCALMIDLGTNGEVILKVGDRYFGASAPAGPALEGGNIGCGIGNVEGGITSAFVRDGEIHFQAKGMPKGLSGTGLIDLVAILLEDGTINHKGVFTKEGKWSARLSERGFLIGNGMFLTQEDVRAFQLAKSAVRTAIAFLLRRTGKKETEIGEVLIAGGMGEGLNIKNAQRTGLIPPSFGSVARSAGNLSLEGASLAIQEGTDRFEKIARRTERIKLTEECDFEKEFVNFLEFPS